jgi:hypothetical protein
VLTEPSHKALQGLVGRILAEEIKSPNSISYRTLDTVKNLDRKDLELFTKIAPFVFLNQCLLKFEAWPNGIIYNNILNLCNAGLILMSDACIKLTKDKHIKFILEFHSILVDIQNAEEAVIPIYKLTEAGINLYPFLNIPDISLEVIESIAARVAEDRQNIFKPKKTHNVKVYKNCSENGRIILGDLLVEIESKQE